MRLELRSHRKTLYLGAWPKVYNHSSSSEERGRNWTLSSIYLGRFWFLAQLCSDQDWTWTLDERQSEIQLMKLREKQVAQATHQGGRESYRGEKGNPFSYTISREDRSYHLNVLSSSSYHLVSRKKMMPNYDNDIQESSCQSSYAHMRKQP